MKIKNLFQTQRFSPEARSYRAKLWRAIRKMFQEPDLDWKTFEKLEAKKPVRKIDGK